MKTKIHYCGLVPPNKIQQNWSLQLANESHSLTSRYGFDNEHDARNAERFALYCFENSIKLTEGRSHESH